MKICDVVMNSIWYDPRVRRQIREYLEQGVDLTCVGYMCERFDKEKVGQLPCQIYLASIDTQYTGKQNCLIRKIKREVYKVQAVKKAIIAQRPDVIHANDLDALIPAYMAKRKLGCRLVYDSHEINVENYISKRRTLLAFVMETLERYLVKRVDIMVCVSNAASNYFAKKYRINKPLVITNCALKSDIIDNNKDKREGFEVLNHGQFYAGRGYDIMARACDLLKRFPEIKLAVRGFGIMEEELHNIVNECENKEHFVFYPKVTIQELIPLAAKSHVGVAITEPICLNFELSVSNKLFEYAAAGLPVIMSDIPEHRYLNDKYHFGIILSDNTAQSFANAVIKLYTDKSLYCELSRNSKQMVQEVNWENEFRSLIQIEKAWH